MKGKLIALIVIAGVFLFAISIFFKYQGWRNYLISLDEGVNAAWAQVENQLQRRADLIPNLVQTVKGYAKHEDEVLTKVTEARAKVGGAGNIQSKIQANNELSSALSRLMVVVERYPDLKANQNFMALQDELSGTENRIAVERKRFNDSAKAYNEKIRQFPYYMVAGRLGLEKKPYFEAVEGAKEVPQVQF